jgi:hypothetical protein
MRQFTVLRCWWRALGGVAVALTLVALGLTEAKVYELSGNLKSVENNCRCPKSLRTPVVPMTSTALARKHCRCHNN